MKSSLFAYGSLMYPEVLSIVLDRPTHQKDLRDATLEGYRRVAIPDKPYPTGIESLGSTIQGKLICGLSEEDLQRLDTYEASFYVRKTVSVETERGAEEAFAYIDGRDLLPFTANEWNQKLFEQKLNSLVRHLNTGMLQA